MKQLIDKELLKDLVGASAALAVYPKLSKVIEERYITKQKVGESLDEEAMWWTTIKNIPDHINKTEIALLVIKSVRDKLNLDGKYNNEEM